MGERGGLQKSLEEGARHQEAKVMVLRLVFGMKKLSLGILQQEDFREGKLSQGTNSK